ncbi:Mu transposase C-terminal domain-containing protein [Priestia koreensis]|uniref:Mu transposase C-terminal domain-containing protein n=1 Tax=Priestia koreensis TaxID=284581 RepID=UPI00203A7F8B|nr:Mu transposase C-terminal domain-containing protein [Priestia koreensis]MCM3006710.1 Mu transposase C-terminal domain-containing protein [Priestia koreensis]
MSIYENQILESDNENLDLVTLQRILWISPDNTNIVVIDITDNKDMKLPFFRTYEDIKYQIESGRERTIEIDPDLRIIFPYDEYLNKYKLERDEKWGIIKDIVVQEPDIYFSEIRGKLIKEVEEKTGKAKKEIYKYLKRYWFYGKSINGLLKNYFDCGAPGKEREISKKTGPKSKDGNEFIVTEKDKENFKWAIKKFHIGEGKSLSKTHQLLREQKYSSGYYRKFGSMVPIVVPEKAPTLRQFLYWYQNEYSFSAKYSNRHGRRKATMDTRPLVGDATARAMGVGYVYEIDSTPADIILVSEDRKTIIGTPTLYIVMDQTSRFIAGYSASVGNPSWIEEAVALENAGTNKVEFCKQYDIDINEEDWPCYHLPKYVLGDRGELKSKMAENLLALKVDVINTPSYRGDLKPFVEQHFNKTNNEIRELLSTVGAKPSKPKQRGEADPARNAALTIYEFNQFMIVQILTYNKSALSKGFFVSREMFEDKVGLTPLEVWNWGKSKRLLHIEPRDLIRYSLLPKASAKVSQYGIEFDKRCYTSELGIKEGWFESKSIDGERNITVSYDPRNVSSIFIRKKNGKLVQCFLTEKFKDYENLHIEEAKAIMKYKKDQLFIKEREELQYQAELHAYADSLAKDAKGEVKVATKDMSFYERNKNKRETKKSESRTFGSKNAWTAIETIEDGNGKTSLDEVVEFPSSVNNLSMEQNKINGIQAQFASKIKERRRNNESLE